MFISNLGVSVSLSLFSQSVSLQRDTDGDREVEVKLIETLELAGGWTMELLSDFWNLDWQLLNESDKFIDMFLYITTGQK
jgi:hypothetical protein